jgi:hypothetical protein
MVERRGTGRTTQQMKDAPKGAVFVWCNHMLDYPEQLKKRIGRDDLKIVAPGWLTFESWRGMKLSGVVIDHAARLSDKQFNSYQEAKARVRRKRSNGEM